MTALILIRHTQTDLAGTFCGHSDPDLNARGKLQIKEVLRRIGACALQRIYSSDLLRARRLAETIANERSIEVTFSAELREINFGEWESMRWPAIQKRFPLESERWLRNFPRMAAPGGESYAGFSARISGILSTIIAEAATAPIALVTHRGVIHFALNRFFATSDQVAWQQTARYGSVIVQPVTASNAFHEEET